MADLDTDYNPWEDLNLPMPPEVAQESDPWEDLGLPKPPDINENPVTYVPEYDSYVESSPDTPSTELIKAADISKNNNSGDYFGNVKISNERSNFGNAVAGVAGTGVSIYRNQVAGSELRKTEMRKEILSRDFQLSDLGYFFAYNAERAVAAGNTLNRLWLSDERRSEMAGRQDAYAGAVRAYNARTQSVLENIGLARPDDVVGGVTYDLGGAFTTIGASIGLGVIAKNPIAATTLFMSIQKNAGYLEADEAGASVANKRVISDNMALAEGALEFVGIKVFTKLAKASGPIVRTLSRALEEGIQEGSQSLAENIITGVGGIRDTDTKRIAFDVAYSMVLGAAAGGGVASIMEIGSKVDRTNKLTQSQKQRMAEGIYDYRAEFRQEMANLLNSELETPMSESGSKALSNIMQKFVSGEKIDVQGEINNIPNMNVGDKKALIEQLSSPSSELNQTLDKSYYDGKINNYNTELRSLEENIDSLTNEAETLIDNNKSAKKVTNKIDRLTNKWIELSNEKQSLSLEMVAKDRQAFVESGNVNEANLTATVLKRIESKNKKDSASKLRKMFKSIVTETKSVVAMSRESVIDVIDSSDLSPVEKKALKASSAVRNIGTKKQAKNTIPNLEVKIEEIIEVRRKKDVREAINKVLDKTKLIKGGKNPVGKFVRAEHQNMFDSLLAANKMNKEQAVELVSEINNSKEPPSYKQSLVNTLIALKHSPKSVSLDRAAEVFIEIEGMYSAAKKETKATKESRSFYIDNIRDDAMSGLTNGGKINPDKRTGTVNALVKKLRYTRSLVSTSSDSFYEVLDKSLAYNTQGRRARDYLSDRYHKAVMGVRYDLDRLNRAYYELAGKTLTDGSSFKSFRATNKLMRDEKVVPWGEHTYADGSVKVLEISRAEARNIYMQMKNPDLAKRITHEDGNNYSDEILDFIENKILSEKDKAFVDAQLDMYQDLYVYVNEVYEKVWGVSLPKIEFYSPVVTAANAENSGMFNPLLEVVNNRPSLAASMMKSRAKEITDPVELQSDYGAMSKYISQVTHFVNSAELSKDMNAIFASDKKFRKDMQSIWGKPMLAAIDHYVYEVTAGHNERTEIQYKFINILHRNAVISLLGGKLNLTPKQLVSGFASLAEVPIDSWVEAMTVFATNPVKAIKAMSEFKYMKTRGASADHEIVRSQSLGSNKLIPRLRSVHDNTVMSPVKLGDRSGVYMSGWAVYYHYRHKLGWSKEKAIVEFEKSSEKTQQSYAPNRRSMWQGTNNPFVKALTAFSTASMGYTRIVTSAVRQYSRGGIEKKELLKIIGIYHFLLPQLFQYVSNAGVWDDEDQLRAAVFGNFNNYYALGDAAYNSFAAVQGIYYNTDTTLPLQGVEDLMLELSNLGAEDFSAKDFFSAIGMIFGFAVKTGINVAEGVGDIEEGDVEKGVLRATGFSERVADKATSNN